MGDMSLVGPRPCLPAQEGFYGSNWPAYCAMKPGPDRPVASEWPQPPLVLSSASSWTARYVRRMVALARRKDPGQNGEGGLDRRRLESERRHAMDNLNKKIYVAGHRGMVGSAIVRQLQARGLRTNIITRTHAELDLTDQAARARTSSQQEQPATGVPGRGQGGRHPRQQHLPGRIHLRQPDDAGQRHPCGASRHGVRKLLFLGSSCIYPRLAPQPMAEDALLTGTLEPTNEPYAIAKIAGIKLCESYNRQYGAEPRHRLPQRDAHQPVRPRRQLPPREQPRDAGADPPLSRSQAKRRAQRHHLGQRHAACASSCTWTTWPPPACT